MSIIISKNNKSEKIDKTDFNNEDYLQNYIYNNPEAIPIYDIDEDKKLFIVKREFSTNSGNIDALAIDKDGEIYVIETKLYKNPDKRKVIAQALDYGAALWRYYNNFDDFLEVINDEVQRKFSLSLEEKIITFFDLDKEQVVSVIDSMKFNLNNGNIKFVILMNNIDNRMKDLILYVNQNSQFDIYGVQLEYYKFEQYEIIIPKIFGSEIRKNIDSKKYRKKLTVEQFLEKVKNNSIEKEFDIIKKILDFFSLDKKGKIIFSNTNTGSAIYKVFLLNKPITVAYISKDKNFWYISFYVGYFEKQMGKLYQSSYKKYINNLKNISSCHIEHSKSNNGSEYDNIYFNIKDLDEKKVEKIKNITNIFISSCYKLGDN